MTETPVDLADYRFEVSLRLMDLNRRDRLALLAELDQMCAELPPGIEPAAGLGPPDVVARALRAATGQPARLPWRTRFRRSTWRFKLGLVLVTAAAVAIGWFATVTNWYTLDFGGSAALPQAADELNQAGDTEEAIYRYRPGRPVVFGFSIANDGRLPVILTGAFDTGEGFVLLIDEIRIGPEDGESRYLPATAVPLDEAEIRPGTDRMIWVVGHLWTCDEQGTSSYTDGSYVRFRYARLRFRVGLTHREQLLELPTIITVRFDRPSPSYCTSAVSERSPSRSLFP